ncbi:MAG: TlpA disulfide reductase family protein [Prevotellaceae bacterium]|nr:TlpA disulfide reductase family protein [Prevotellaceae bacterium]
MKRLIILIVFLGILVSRVFAQDYEAMNRYMEKYSGNWCKMSVTDAKAQLGTPMPEYSFSKSLSSKALRGKTVVLTYWATWCGGCRLLCVDLDSVMVKHSDEYANVQIIGVDADEKLVNKGYVPSTFWKEKNIGYPTTAPGKAADACAKSIDAGHPTTVIIDGEGIIRGRWDAWSPGTAGDIALASWIMDIAPRQGIKVDVPTVDRLLSEKHFDRALYLLEQMPLDTLSISQRWEAMLNVSGQKATEIYLSLKKKFNGNSEDEAGRFRKPDRKYVVMMSALCDVIYDNNIQDPEILKIGREAASLAANWGDQSCRSSFKVQELSLRYAQAVYNRSAKSLVTNLKYARQDNDTKKIEVLESILKKYGISESENEEISKDHQRMM